MKACTFERLAFISLGFGRGAQVEKTSLLKVNLLRRKRRRWAYSFLFGTLQALGSHQIPPSLEDDEAFFLQCEAKMVRRHTSRQRSGVVSQQRLRPRRFDSTVKRLQKIRFEPVSFLFLVCL